MGVNVQFQVNRSGKCEGNVMCEYANYCDELGGICKDLQAQDNQIEKLQQRIEDMRVVLQHYLDLLERANNGDAVAECKLFEDIVLIEQVLNKLE